MKLTPKQRERLFAMFDGHCAYCGHPLPAKGWHGDHVEPVMRDWWHAYELKRWRERGCIGERPVSRGLGYPERDRIENMMPACRACNIDKGPCSLETWRRSLEQRAEVCRRNHSAFRHAERFGRVIVVEGPLLFHFEKVAQELTQ